MTTVRPARPTRRRRLRALARTACAAALVLAVAGPAGVAQADKRDDLVRQQQENAEQREQLEASLEGVDTNLAGTYLALEDARARLPLAQAELVLAEEALAASERKQEQVTARLGIAEAEAASLATQIEDGAAKIDTTRSAMGELARSTYRGDNAVSTISVVLDASSTEEFLKSYSVMETAVRAQTQVLGTLETDAAVARNQRERQEAVTERIGELKDEADAAVAEADAARAAAAERAAEIQKIEADMTTLAAQLETQKQTYSGELAEVESSGAALAGEIAAIDEANRKAEEERQRKAAEQRARDEAAARAGKAPAVPAPPATGGGGALIPPVPNPMYVTSAYGFRIYPISGGWWMHNGTDVRSACGNPQVASAGGTVAAVKPAAGNGTHGNQVLINHGIIGGSSYVTVYNHLSSFAVSAGERVSQGQTVGRTGATGNVTGCHVHFEVWKNGSTIDPMDLPGFVQVN
ncbi:M23 family metallopeptidase [Georgenia sp. SYP-B2076]|uniref:M23 family metallopeptidase n=1 Tax=Georgenia sp. SYP-B2076 TaxID=2495881 RepID=UPI00197AC260|nr:M23 family metallopeptidase [Georgenia sp. SYP-B2076]